MEIKKIGYPIKRASYTKSLSSRLRGGTLRRSHRNAGRLCRSKGIELSRKDIRQMRQSYVSVAVALICLIVLVATSALSLIDARVGLALIAFELVGAGVGAFAAKKSVDDNWERIKEKQQAKESRAEQRKKKKEASDAGND